MPRDGSKDFAPFISAIYFVDLEERFVRVGRAGDKRRARFDRAVACHPIEGIAPAVFRESRAARMLQATKKVSRSLEMALLSGRHVKEGKSHCIMGVSNWKSAGLVEQPAGRRDERFEKDHRCDRGGAEQLVAVVQRLRTSTNRASEETLMIRRCFAELLQPCREVRQRGTNLRL